MYNNPFVIVCVATPIHLVLIINRHSEPADSFQTYQVMLVESGRKVILEAVSN